MKKTLFCIIVLMFSFANNFFGQAMFETSQELNKQQHPAFVVTYNFTDDIANEAISRRLKADKIKFKSSKEVFTCERASYPMISPNPIDLYFKVVGDKKMGTTMVYVFVSKGYDNFVSQKDDSLVAANVSALFQAIKADARQVRIENQQVVLNNAQKEVEKSLKKLADMQDKIKAQEQEIVDKRAIVDKEGQRLESIKGEI
jgi:hypothetical protein